MNDKTAGVTGVELRNVLGRFPTGVTVVAVAAKDGEDVHAMTASSFLSVSLDPPLVLISLGQATRMHAELSVGQQYSISILRQGQDDIASAFATRSGDRRRHLSRWEALPVVRPALAYLAIEPRVQVPAGDHYLHIGQVRRYELTEGPPLVHFQGRFRQLEDEYDAALPLSWRSIPESIAW